MPGLLQCVQHSVDVDVDNYWIFLLVDIRQRASHVHLWCNRIITLKGGDTIIRRKAVNDGRANSFY